MPINKGRNGITCYTRKVGTERMVLDLEDKELRFVDLEFTTPLKSWCDIGGKALFSIQAYEVL